MTIGSIRNYNMKTSTISAWRTYIADFLLVGGGSGGAIVGGYTLRGGTGGAVNAGITVLFGGVAYIVTVGAGGNGFNGSGTATSIADITASGGAAVGFDFTARGGRANNGAIQSTTLNGADGVESDLSGVAIKYGPGGGGTQYTNPTYTYGTGGLNGGGNGPGGNGDANSGGGAASGNSGTGRGGSGIAIIRTPDVYPVFATTGSPTITTSGGYRIYKFTGTGTITPV